MSFTLTVIINAVAILAVTFLAFVVHRANRATPFKGYNSFMGLILCIILWTSFYMLELLLPNMNDKLAVIKIEYIGISFFPCFWVCYLIDSADRRVCFSRAIKIALISFGGFYSAAAWINPFEEFYRESHLQYKFGAYFIEHTYGLILRSMHVLLVVIFISCTCTLLTSLIKKRTSKHRALTMIVATLLPLVISFFYISGIVDYDLTNVGIGLSAVGIAVFMFSSGNLDAKKYVINNMIELLSHPVIVLDKELFVLHANAAAQRLFDMPAKSFSSGVLTLEELIPDCPDLVTNPRAHMEIELKASDALVYYQLHRIPLNVHGNQGSFVMFNDITSQKKISQQLNSLTDYDSGTGLLNANRFLRIMEEYRTDHENGLIGTSICFVGVGNLKTIKKVMSLEHEQLLGKALAALISPEAPAGSVMAYFGNFEFALFLQRPISIDALEQLKQRYSSVTLTVANYTYSIELCIGLYNIEQKIAPEEAIGEATFTMRSVIGTNNFYRCHDPLMHTTLDISKELMKDLALEDADKCFTLVYQPVVDIAKNTVIGAEALLRWTHPQMGFISPALFIPIAERTNAIYMLGELVIKKCCNFLRENKSKLPPHFRLLVNISKREIDDSAHIDKLIDIVIASGISFRSLEFEITETIASRDISRVIDFTSKMKTVGARIALDDFGSGNTALAYISDLNCDTVKIDTSMSDNAIGDARRTKLLAAIYDLCNAMELDTIMEHVETKKTLTYFSNCGYHLMQGYLFSQPLPADKIGEFVASFQSDAVQLNK